MDKTQIIINLRREPLPDGLRSIVKEDAPGKYEIFLNANKGKAEQAAGFIHECLHIYHNDTSSPDDTGEIEQQRRVELLQICRYLLQA